MWILPLLFKVHVQLQPYNDITQLAILHISRYCTLYRHSIPCILVTKTTANKVKSRLVIIEHAGYIFWQLFLRQLYLDILTSVFPIHAEGFLGPEALSALPVGK